MSSQPADVGPSFYCNHCDKWVDGIEVKEGPPAPPGFRQALCDDCGNTVMYRLPSFWQHFQRSVADFLGSVFGGSKK